MKVDLNLVSIEDEDLIITLKAFDDNNGDDDDNDNDDNDDDDIENENNLWHIINKSRIKVKVVMVM